MVLEWSDRGLKLLDSISGQDAIRTSVKAMLKLTALPAELVEVVASFLKLRELVRLSDTCRTARRVYVSMQGRVREVRASNVKGARRTRAAVLAQIRHSPRLEVLSLVNVKCHLPDSLITQAMNMTTLRHLDLSGCDLKGQLPESIGSLQRLKTLCLANNKLTGPLPASLGALAELEVIKLSFNNFEGPIPASWAGLKKARVISLSYNKLTGPIPTFLCGLSHLESLLLGCNSFTGEIPREIGKLRRLTSLYVFQNKLEGAIPEELGNCRRLIRVLLGGNLLRGNLPASLAHITHLRELILSMNQLGGSILPRTLVRLKELQTLDLTENRFAPDELQPAVVLKQRGCQVYT